MAIIQVLTKTDKLFELRAKNLGELANGLMSMGYIKQLRKWQFMVNGEQVQDMNHSVQDNDFVCACRDVPYWHDSEA